MKVKIINIEVQGIFVEAISLRKIVFVSGNTWMSKELKNII